MKERRKENINRGIALDKEVQMFFKCVSWGEDYSNLDKFPEELAPFLSYPLVQNAIKQGKWSCQKPCSMVQDDILYRGVVDLILLDRVYDIKCSELKANELAAHYLPQIIGYCVALNLLPGGLFVYNPSLNIWFHIDMKPVANSLQEVKRVWNALMRI